MNPAVCWKLEYGMYIVCSGRENRFNGQIANTVFQITAEPATFAISINKSNYTHEFIQDSKVFTISILNDDADMKLIGHFGFRTGRDMDKFADMPHKIGITGAPYITKNVLGYIECELINTVDCGTHTLFIGKMVEGDIISEEDIPMTYAFYHLVKKGKSPKTAPTYLDLTKKETS